MNIINPRLHGVLDYLTVIVLLAAPSIFHMTGSLESFTYLAGGFQLLLSILTNYPLALWKLIPFRIHGNIETVIAILLVVAAFWFRHMENNLGFKFYLIAAAVYFIVIGLTNYTTAGYINKRSAQVS